VITSDFKNPCRHLRARAPDEWQRFVVMFDEYTFTALNAVLDADASNILEAKGFAQACKALAETFHNLDAQEKRNG